jgi:hypothetical protein
MISYRYQYLLDNICFSMATKSSGRIKIRPELPVPGTMAYYCCKATDPPPCLLMVRKKIEGSHVNTRIKY